MLLRVLRVETSKTKMIKNNEIEWDDELGWFKDTIENSDLYEQDKELNY